MKPACILAIDDDPAVLRYLSRTLQDRYKVVVTSSPRSALQMAQSERPILILCDIDMPEMDGGAVCAALAADASTRDIPFVYLTGMVSPSEVEELGGYVGGKPGISKRASLEELVACIEKHLGHGR